MTILLKKNIDRNNLLLFRLRKFLVGGVIGVTFLGQGIENQPRFFLATPQNLPNRETSESNPNKVRGLAIRDSNSPGTKREVTEEAVGEEYDFILALANKGGLTGYFKLLDADKGSGYLWSGLSTLRRIADPDFPPRRDISTQQFLQKWNTLVSQHHWSHGLAALDEGMQYLYTTEEIPFRTVMEMIQQVELNIRMTKPLKFYVSSSGDVTLQYHPANISYRQEIVFSNTK